MLTTKFQGHRPFGSGEDFLRFLPYMGMAAILVMWPGPFEQTFVPPSHGESIWNLASIGPVVSEEMFKECGRQTDGRRRPTCPISSPTSLRLRWAKNLLWNQKADDLESLYAASNTRVLPNLFKWWPWVDRDLFYGKLKFGPLCFYMTYMGKR